MSAAHSPRYSPGQYLALERKAEHRSEYLNGQIIAMSGASREHNVIALNLAREISGRLRGGPCETYVSDMRVRVLPTGLYTYPDVVVVCGDRRFEDDCLDTLLNPTVIVEVLSPSTESYDRGRKFGHYRHVESLREYVLVAQDRPAVEHYTRRDGEWVLTDVTGPDAVLRLASVGCEVPLSEVYDRIEFPPEVEPEGFPRPVTS
jgi:Uma2 family endonuclease